MLQPFFDGTCTCLKMKPKGEVCLFNYREQFYSDNLNNVKTRPFYQMDIETLSWQYT